jgi:hypothetical protein
MYTNLTPITDEKTRQALKELLNFYQQKEKTKHDYFPSYAFNCPLCELYWENNCINCPWKVWAQKRIKSRTTIYCRLWSINITKLSHEQKLNRIAMIKYWLRCGV